MKIKRHVCAVHLLISRERRGRTEYLLYSHDKWHGAEPGTFALALPTKKVAAGKSPYVHAPEARNRTLADLLTEDLGLGLRNRHLGYRLQPAAVDLMSPTCRLGTRYNLLPVSLPLPGHEQHAVQRRLHGEWLTAAAALAHPHLSPTARPILETLRPTPRPAPLPRTHAPRSLEWTALFLAARQGDHEQLGVLFESMRPMFASRLRSVLPDLSHEDIEDAVSMMFLKAFQHLERFDEERGPLEAWLWALAKHEGVTILRRRRGFVLSLDAVPGLEVGAQQDPALLAEQNDELRATHEMVNQLLAGADPLLREALVRHYLEGKKLTQISQELGVPYNPLCIRLTRLKAKIRALQVQ